MPQELHLAVSFPSSRRFQSIKGLAGTLRDEWVRLEQVGGVGIVAPANKVSLHQLRHSVHYKPSKKPISSNYEWRESDE